MSSNSIVTAKKGGLSVTAYVGVEMVMLAMNLDEDLTHNLAGFAIKCTTPDGTESYLQNRLTFKNSPEFEAITADTKTEAMKWHDSNTSPFQYFRWLHVPSEILSGTYTYEVIPKYFGSGAGKLKLTNGHSVKVGVTLFNNHPRKFNYGFTKGYISSQAYTDKFGNKDIRPKGPKTIDYDTKPYKAQYEWLGGKASKMLFDFLKECLADKAQVKALVYDCDHPEIIEYFKNFGTKLKMILDNASLHHDTKKPKPEDQVFRVLKKSSKDNIVRGHFQRFQHNKVLIKVVNGTPVKVFTGSANFSIRGFYVQANNCIVIDDKDVAAKYNEYFEAVYKLMKAGKSGETVNAQPVTGEWFDFKKATMPTFSVSFSPHKNPPVSLALLQKELAKANSSILFSIMQIEGGGEPLQYIRELPDNKGSIFHYGVIESAKQDDTKGSDFSIIQQGKEGGVVPFSFLKGKVPAPFNSEFSGGMGQVIHDKFVVIDFNTSDPVVFTGSSNLALGGEQSNGDNLLAIYDEDVAVAYAIEAVRLFDHYNFRSKVGQVTGTLPPLVLKDTDAWAKPYYEKSNRKCTDRIMFAK